MPWETGAASNPEFFRVMLRRMQQVHPEKFEYVGEPALMALVARSIQEAEKASISTGAGVSLILGLMFVIGHGCVNDPKFPWIAKTLAGPAQPNPNNRVERLYSKSAGLERGGNDDTEC